MKMKLLKIAIPVTISLALLGAAAPATAHNNQTNCSRETLSVKLTETDTQNYNVVGWLCAKGALRNQTVQVLVSGLTYDHTYWDFSFQNGIYSYVKYATSFGFATFNIDRIGVGESARPPADQVTVPTEAFTVKQIVHQLKAGQVAHHKFNKVVGVGHSLGAAILTIAGSYPDSEIDGLVLADYTHAANVPFIISIGAMRHPASEEPQFVDAPTGYFTSVVGTRGTQFFTEKFANPGVIAKDEELKATGTSAEAATVSAARNPAFSNAIRVPVLVVVGQQDNLDCDESVVGLSCVNNKAIMDREAPLFTSAASFEAWVLPLSGHSTNLHRTAPLFFLKSNLWALTI